MRKTFFLIGTLFLFIHASLSLATAPPPTVTYGYTVDFDNYGVTLYGANYDTSTYVDIRSTTSGTILLSVGPPNITFLPGTTTDELSFRINDPTLQNLLSTPGLRFYVVSPTANYQWAGPLTLQRGSPSYTSQPAAFHSAYFRPAQATFWAMLADDTGSPSPRQQAIWSINNNFQALHAAGLDTVSVFLNDNDGWPSQEAGGFSYDPLNDPTPQRAVGEEIVLRIAAANNLKVIFVIATNVYRESTDGRAAWNGLADQYGVTPAANGALDFIHSVIDPTPYYGFPTTTKLSTIGLTDGPIRGYFNDPRVRGFILAPEFHPGIISTNGVDVQQYFFNKYFNWFYSIVHYNNSQTSFAGVYLIGSPSDGMAAQVALVKKFKSWFRSGTGNNQPDMIGVESYGFSGYPLQNLAADMNVIFDAMITANTVTYPGDFAIPSTKIFIAEANNDTNTDAYTNQFYVRAMQSISKRVLGGMQWFAADTYSDGNPPTTNGPAWELYNWSFALTGAKMFTSTLPVGKVWHGPAPNPGGSYADPTTFPSYTDNFSMQWGKITYTSRTPKGNWYSEAISDFVAGNNTSAFAYPNPAVGNAQKLAATTVYWDATERPAVTAVAVHLGSPSGTLVGSGSSAGSITTGTTVTNGSIFFVQDVTGGKPLTAANTLSQVYVNVQ